MFILKGAFHELRFINLLQKWLDLTQNYCVLQQQQFLLYCKYHLLLISCSNRIFTLVNLSSSVFSVLFLQLVFIYLLQRVVVQSLYVSFVKRFPASHMKHVI
jgi:hypothetical protein